MAETARSSDEESKSLADLPTVTWWRDSNQKLFQWKGCWLRPAVIEAMPAIETQFKPLPTDILLASFPKTGTTWLKALTVSILSSSSSSTHNNYSKQEEDDPLQTHNPHELVPFLEAETFGGNQNRDFNNQFPSTRVFSTHLPYSILPEKVKNSGCRIVYISRNPADTFVSGWHFFNNRFGITIPLEEAFDDFCNGVVFAGPFFDHVLEYWKEREKENVFFVTYEELKEDPNKHVKRLAEFLGCLLNSDEVEKVVWKSSIERLRNLDVNTDESKVNWSGVVKFTWYFRKGAVGDGKNHLTSEMMERLQIVADHKWEGSGLEL